ncbi:MAG: hypothetical protein EOQ83_21600 [Mesorhizobium sp.]|uniref:hypothetical protein n=1 Tax=Mesorhizobium sp. TaxID=1871066 RepID=UPI000FE76135|nr:hypothetical protein [Mesorhizobium sp.]RWH61337.1 MAG: hypothetical protein EOQ83_21600 [Mesorhizobium sp.]
MISAQRQIGDYSDREIDFQEAIEPGFQAVIDCMLDAGWLRGEVTRSFCRLTDNMTQKESFRVEAELVIAEAMIRAGRRSSLDSFGGC